MTRTRHFGIFAIAVVALVAVTAMLFCAAPTVSAETGAEIKIAPDETSLYAAYDGHVAYTTKDGVLHLSTIGNSVSKGFSGTALDIAMTEEFVFLLTDSSGNKKLSAYSVTDGVLGEEQDVFEKFAVSDSLYSQFANKIDSITVTGNMLTVSAGDAGDYTWFCSIPFSAQALPSLSINLGLGTVDDMATTDAAADDTYLVYTIFDGDLCFLRLPASPVEAQPIETSGKWLSVAALDGEIYAAATDGVYHVVRPSSKFQTKSPTATSAPTPRATRPICSSKTAPKTRSFNTRSTAMDYSNITAFSTMSSTPLRPNIRL